MASETPPLRLVVLDAPDTEWHGVVTKVLHSEGAEMERSLEPGVIAILEALGDEREVEISETLRGGVRVKTAKALVYTRTGTRFYKC